MWGKMPVGVGGERRMDRLAGDNREAMGTQITTG